jgi:hypothetical protein
MSLHTVTLKIPEKTYRRANKVAKVLRKSIEDVVTDAVGANLPDLDDVPREMEAELAAMAYLSNEALLALANAAMDETRQELLQTHLESQGRNELHQNEQRQLASLMAEYGQTMLRRAKAMALLLERGHPVSFSRPS